MSQGRNFGLDLVRAMAIGLVLVDHFAPWLFSMDGQGTLIAAFVGKTGVELFFSLSGFLIGPMLIKMYEQPIGIQELTHFWCRRWLRTIPAYWVFLLLLTIYWSRVPWYEATFANDLLIDWRSPFFLQNFVPNSEWVQFSSVSWSLVLEEWFYLSFPFFLFLAQKMRLPVDVSTICGGVIIVCFVLRVLAIHSADPIWGPDRNINPILRLDCAAWGVLAAQYTHKNKLLISFATGFVLIGLGLFYICFRIWLWTFQSVLLGPSLGGWGVALTQAMEPTSLEIAAALFVMGLHALLPKFNGFGSVLTVWLSKTSYSIYLVHLPIWFISGAPKLALEGDWIGKIWVSVLVVAAAITLREIVEKPALRLRDALFQAEALGKK